MLAGETVSWIRDRPTGMQTCSCLGRRPSVGGCMSETQVLLAKISALRQRLEQAQGLANEARSAAAALLAGHDLAHAGESLEHAVAVGDQHDLALEAAVQPVTGVAILAAGHSPRALTSRAR